jgi:hypothetical protein
MPRKGNRKSSNAKAEQRKQPGIQRAAKPEDVAGRVIERPDGFYWERSKGDMAGPYTTLAEAEADMLADGAADDLESPESLQEAESELGVSEWIDPDTGAPAEDNVPRLEDH